MTNDQRLAIGIWSLVIALKKQYLQNLQTMLYSETMWPFRRKHREKTRTAKMMKKMIVGVIIGGAIGSIIGKKLVDDREDEDDEKD